MKLATIAIVLLLAAPLALAEDDGEPEKVVREVDLTVDGLKATYDLERENGPEEDELQIFFDAAAGKMGISYETENATAETEVELEVIFTEVIEFVDADGDGAFDPKKDERVRTYEIQRLAWTLEDPRASGGAGVRIAGVGAFPEGGTIAFVLTVFGDFANVNGTDLKPSDAKIDILLDDFPFTRDDSMVALRIETEQEVETEGKDAPSLETLTKGLSAYFTWATKVEVDGAFRDVGTTILEGEADGGEREDVVYLAYPRGAAINHDPVLGIASAGSAKTVPFAPAALLVAIVAALALAVRRAG